MMKAAERVFVKTGAVEGMATVLHVVRNEIYPVQVELDNPDSDGHKIIRVAYNEIVKGNADYKPSQSTRVVESTTPELQRQMSFFDLI